MIDEATLKSLVEAQVRNQLAQGVPDPTPEEQEPRVIALETLENLMLENIILKEQLEERRKQDEARRLNEQKLNFQNHLAEKYAINTETHSLTVNAQSSTLTITPRGMATDN